jgi:hypothetical protein
MLGETSRPYGNGDSSKELALVLQSQPLQLGSKGIGANHGGLRGGVRKDNGKLFPSVSATYISSTEESAKDVGNGTKHKVTCVMPKRVVKSFEVIEVNQQDRERRFITPGAPKFGLK